MRPICIMTSIIAFAFDQYFRDVIGEFVRYFDHLNSTEWAIISASAVTFGFVCLRGTTIRD